MVILLTGMSGSGKSTLVAKLDKILKASGYHVEVMDGDGYRKVLCEDLSFSEYDRKQNAKRLGYVARRMERHKIVVLIAAIVPYEESRDLIQTFVGKFVCIHVDCPLEVLKERDPKGLYRKALLPEGDPEKIKHFTGIDDPFEPPAKPHVRVRTDLQTIEESIEQIVSFLREEKGLEI